MSNESRITQLTAPNPDTTMGTGGIRGSALEWGKSSPAGQIGHETPNPIDTDIAQLQSLQEAATKRHQRETEKEEFIDGKIQAIIDLTRLKKELTKSGGEGTDATIEGAHFNRLTPELIDKLGDFYASYLTRVEGLTRDEIQTRINQLTDRPAAPENEADLVTRLTSSPDLTNRSQIFREVARSLFPGEDMKTVSQDPDKWERIEQLSATIADSKGIPNIS